MISRVMSAVLFGINGYCVEVETHISNGLPCHSVVGLPNQVVKESKERVRSAIKNCGYKFPDQRITQNMSPANLKKEGSHLDLPMAMGIISHIEDFSAYKLDRVAFIGELSLEGLIRPVRGVLSLVEGLKEEGYREIVIPSGNYNEIQYIRDVNIYAYSQLKDLIYAIKDGKLENKVACKSFILKNPVKNDSFDEVVGQNIAVRAMQIAVSGFFNILMIGPPGCGKSMIAERAISLMPDLTLDESLELTKIYSLTDEGTCNELISKRPLRVPHHTITRAALVGGGSRLEPGEISKAHLGILMLDELPEFKKEVIEALREPISMKKIQISRNQRFAEFPADFMLIGTMNPCQCGNLFSKRDECRCNIYEINRYLSKLSGPILDRIDMHIYLDAVDINSINEDNKGKLTATKMIEEIKIAMELQRKRGQTCKTSQLSKEEIKKWCSLSQNLENRLRNYQLSGKLTMRGYDKLLRLSRAIADLDGCDEINSKHLMEALMYRDANRLKQR